MIYVDLQEYQNNLFNNYLANTAAGTFVLETNLEDFYRKFLTDEIEDLLIETIYEQERDAYQLQQWLEEDDRVSKYMQIVLRDRMINTDENYDVWNHIFQAHCLLEQDLASSNVKYIVRYFVLEYMIENYVKITYEQLIHVWDCLYEIGRMKQAIEIVKQMI